MTFPVSQDADKVLDHFTLFRQPEYKALFERKKAEFEYGHSDEKVAEVSEWTKSEDYKAKNFAREAVVINPTKACQPIGAMFAAQGFEGTLPFVHGSQGCVAYYRTHLTRHFKEPNSAVSSSMTEDAAVFGGLNNMIDGLANAYTLYKPKMIAVLTTCMAEVIGDDLAGFITNAKNKESVPQDFPVPHAHTPAFVGSHIVGYDNMMKGILSHFWDKAENFDTPKDESINLIGGFDGYAVGNNRELKRIFDLFGIKGRILSDVSDVFDTPADGEYRMYDGGTTLEETKAALHAKATISLQEYNTTQTLQFCKEKGQEVAKFNYPMGIAATDELLVKLSELTGKPIPEALKLERGRLVDAFSDSHAHLHGKRFAIYGDPDFCLGMTRFLLELGAEPVHILSTSGSKKWEKQVQKTLDGSPFGKDGKAYGGKDLWHLRSLLFTDKVDYIIGNSYGKYLERDTKIPLIRLTYPVFDRHHHHRYPTWGYQGALNVLVRILDRIFEDMDATTNEVGKTDYSFDLIR
ncbi:nitrogenase molybdenum-iron protein subunit beta [Azospirillum sp.]|uniref:nitrogenase molybdenum-iron protein subunit beta n=1 Tax=Azospirillum sp. TaxID=34012 RepID=UPI002D231B77|nr:nitrogenase molybdenum-iron protein subunit beta [Azospirillum sp.]HYD64387.1 nitrogenase molybdenum-iron protein subunit beta [Azospirillum sp.]